MDQYTLPIFFLPLFSPLFFPLFIHSFFLPLFNFCVYKFYLYTSTKKNSSCSLLPTRMLSEYFINTFFFPLFNVFLYIFCLHTSTIPFFSPFFLYYCQYIFCLYTSTILSSVLFLISVNTCSLCMLLQ